jgi:hypothetical protein
LIVLFADDGEDRDRAPRSPDADVGGRAPVDRLRAGQRRRRFGSLLWAAPGWLAVKSGVLPRWLGWVSILAGILLFLQGFGLGGVIALFGLVLDLIGFLVLLIFVLVSSLILLRRGAPAVSAGGRA